MPVFEVCTEWRGGTLELPTPPRHYDRESELPVLHRDPFDRLLVARAIERVARMSW